MLEIHGNMDLYVVIFACNLKNLAPLRLRMSCHCWKRPCLVLYLHMLGMYAPDGWLLDAPVAFVGMSLIPI